MKNIIFLVCVAVLIPTYALCKDVDYLFKDYYFGMSKESANLIKKIVPIEINEETSTFKVEGKEEFSKGTWDVELFFIQNKLFAVNLSSTSEANIFGTHVLSTLNKNGFVNIVLCTESEIFDKINMYKTLTKDDANNLSMYGLSRANNSKFFASAYIERDIYAKFSENKKNSFKKWDDVFKSFPVGKRIVIFRNYGKKYFLTFGASLYAAIIMDAHMSTMTSAKGGKEF